MTITTVTSNCPHDDYVDFIVDGGKFSIHLKRNDVGWSVDFHDTDGELLEGKEVQIWDDELGLDDEEEN